MSCPWIWCLKPHANYLHEAKCCRGFRRLTWCFHPRCLLSCFDNKADFKEGLQHPQGMRVLTTSSHACVHCSCRTGLRSYLNCWTILSHAGPVLTTEFKPSSCWLIMTAQNYWPPFKWLWSRLAGVLTALLCVYLTAAYIKCRFRLFSCISALELG